MQMPNSANSCNTKRSYKVAEIMDILEIGRTTAYKLAHSGAFEIRKIGSTIRIPKASFDEWFDKRHQT